jgi:hypothetical protein
LGNNAGQILVVTVNHSTSPFVELMLRTLFLTNDVNALDLRIVVLDNSSKDEGIEQLKEYLKGQDIALVQTGLDDAVQVEKHGAALTDFVMKNNDCSHYLFLDSDMWFFETQTIPTMLAELECASDGVFANQARIRGYFAHRIIEADGYQWAEDCPPAFETVCNGMRYEMLLAKRCSPVCSLVSNTNTFRKVVEAVGLGPATRFGVGRAFHNDTFGLMTNVMATHGLGFIVSARSVNHFTETSYKPQRRGGRDSACARMLAELRAGRGMSLDLFRESDWYPK